MKKKTLVRTIFASTLTVIVGFFVTSIIKTSVYNSQAHEQKLTEAELFTSEPDKSQKASINVVPRDGTWGKIFDFNNEGIEENNYTAYTFDFFVTNNTSYEVDYFSFKLEFKHEAFVAQAWNGSMEVHQFIGGVEHAVTIPDLRVYNPKDYDLDYFFLEEEPFIHMKSGDFLVYHPSESLNALEMPVKPHEGTTPGIIIYIANGENINNSIVTFNYTLHKLFVKDIFFMMSLICFAIWAVVLIIYIIFTVQYNIYKARYERDNKIISESMETFIGFIDAKDTYTNGHSRRVAIYTTMLAKEMGFEGEELDRIYYIALLHDCGKMGIPDNILCKPGKLTKEEFEIIKSHTTRGGEILSNFKSLENAGEGALYHHERYDGNGYPKGIKGEDIPLIARMICVADAFDAMNSSRVYREKLSKEFIISEFEKYKGTQFDPKIAEIMLRLIKEGKIETD